MAPDWYFNLSVAVASGEQGPPGFAIDVLARTLHIVHGIGARHGITYASAFPDMRTGDRPHPGTVLRIFTSMRADGDALLDQLEASGHPRDYLYVGRVRRVPLQQSEGEGASSVSYCRFRTTGRHGKNPETRLRRLAAGDRLPYLKMSSSQGQRFSLRINVVRHAAPPSGTCEPDGYGLCVSERPFSLPDFSELTQPWQRAPSTQR